MKKLKNYPKELKEKVLREARETGNIGLVADKYEINRPTVYSWIKNDKYKEKNQTKKSIKTLEKELAEKGLENKILRELLKKTTVTLIKD